jgi:hypothetical protein
MSCYYHQKVHTKEEYKNTHINCLHHGHCLNPIECPLFKNCPAHVNGRNMFLAWSVGHKKVGELCHGDHLSSSCSSSGEKYPIKLCDACRHEDDCTSSSCSASEDDLFKACNQKS